MASEDCDWPVKEKMSHIVDSIYMYMYCIFKVAIHSHMYIYDVHVYIIQSCSSHDEAISSRIVERDLVYMYIHHNKQLVIGTVYICNLLCKYIV